METNVSPEIYDGPSFFTMPSNYLHRPVVIIPITAKTEKSVTHRPGTRWRQGRSSLDQYFIYSLRVASIPVSNSFTESHERNEVCCKTPIQRPCFLGVLMKEAGQQSLSGKQYALKVTHYSLLLENKVPLAWCGNGHQSTAHQKKYVCNLVVLLGMKGAVWTSSTQFDNCGKKVFSWQGIICLKSNNPINIYFWLPPVSRKKQDEEERGKGHDHSSWASRSF